MAFQCTTLLFRPCLLEVEILPVSPIPTALNGTYHAMESILFVFQFFLRPAANGVVLGVMSSLMQR